MNHNNENEFTLEKEDNKAAQKDSDFYKYKERIEWQGMLASVLTGDVIESEKIRISKNLNSSEQNLISYNIWLEIRAKINNRTVQCEIEELNKERKRVYIVIDRVKNFLLNQEVSDIEQVMDVLKQLEKVQSLYTSTKALIKQNPEFSSEEFQYNLRALISWCTLTLNIQLQIKILKDWTGSDSLKIIPKSDTLDNKHPPFIERILKENSLQRTFEIKTLTTLNQLILKTKQDLIENNQAYIKMKLTPHYDELQQLISFPANLMEECLRLRLDYSSKLNNPTTMMVDQLFEDFKLSLSLACRIKEEYLSIIEPSVGWSFSSCINENYDTELFSNLKFYFKLLNWKLTGNKILDSNEIDILYTEYKFLKGLSSHFSKAEVEIAIKIW